MKLEPYLRQCRDALLALSDPDLMLLIQQWIVTTNALDEDEAQTVEEQVENLLCLRLGYTIHSRRTRKQYPSLTAFLGAEDGDRWTLQPPTPQDLRIHLAGMSLRDFNRTLIVCAFSAPLPRNAPLFEQPGREFLDWLAQAIRENRILDRGRPRCLFYCFGYRLGLLPAGMSQLPTAESDPLPRLHQVWENYMTHLLLKLRLFPETQDELQALFLTWAARGLRDAQSSLAINAGLEIILLLYKQTPGLTTLAPTASERLSPASAATLEQLLRLLLWDRSP